MSSIRVGTITFDWYPFEPRVLRLVQAAVDAGYAVDVICLHQLHEKRYEIHDGVHIYRMPMSRGYGLSLPMTVLYWCWFLLLAEATITWLHLKHAYDVIQVHNMPDFLVFATLFPKLLGAKIVLDVQDACPELMAEKAKGRLRKIVILLAMWQERLSTAFADHVVTVGWTVEELLLQRGVPKEKLTSILNSADPKVFPPSRRSFTPPAFPDELRPFILMYHGSVEERQGLDTAIRALVLAQRVVPQLRLDIKGFGEAPNLKQLAAKLGVSDSVVFSKRCPVGEVVDFVVHGDVGIMPYRGNGYMELVLPTKGFEFAWMHRPMIASDTRGIRSMFRPESIVLCDASKPESFAEAIIDLYQHPEKRACMVEKAAEDYMAHRWETQAERYQQLLASLSRKHLQEQLPTANSSYNHLQR